MSRGSKSVSRFLSPAKALGAALLVTTLAGSLPLNAKDLGVQGQTWKVVEIDMRQLIVGNNADLDPK